MVIALTACVAVMSSCSSNKPASAPENYFTLWNDCEALTALQDISISMRDDFKTIYGYSVEKGNR